MKIDTLFKFTLVGGLCGYELVAAIVSVLGVESRPFSIAIRGIVASIALCLIFISVHEIVRRRYIVILGFFVFWFCYCIRIAYSAYISTEQLMYVPSYYWTWAVGACALPMLAVALWLPKITDARKVFLLLFVALSIAGAVASFGGSSLEVNENNQLVETGRLQLASLNPILLGQLGATMVVLSIWGFLVMFRRDRLWYRVGLLVSMAIGAVLLIGANSRGPLISAFLCLLFIVVFSSSRVRFYASLTLVLAGAAFVPLTYYLEQEFGFSTYTRLFEQSQVTEESTQNRLGRYDSALEGIASHPLTGVGLEEPVTGGYPHNIFIEAFMSMGFLPGLLLLGLVLIVLYRCVINYRVAPMFGWSSLLFIQYLIASQFSGALYTVNYFWISVGLVLAVWASSHQLVDRSSLIQPSWANHNHDANK